MTDLKIKSHARKRYVERIRQPSHYAHLSTCKLNCSECQKLNGDLECVVNNFGRKIDWEIGTSYREAKSNNWIITDFNFIEAIKQKYGEIGAGRRSFYRNKNAVFVVIEDEEVPVLVTVLDISMIEGTVLDAFVGTNKMSSVFSAWKFQAKQRKFR